MVMPTQLWRLEYVRDGINLDNQYLCLPLTMSHVLWEGTYTEVVCTVVRYMAQNMASEEKNELTPLQWAEWVSSS